MEARRRKKKSKDVPAVTSSKSLLAALAFGQIRCCAKLCTSFGFIVLLWILLRAHVGKSYVAAHFTLKVDGHATESTAALPLFQLRGDLLVRVVHQPRISPLKDPARLHRLPDSVRAERLCVRPCWYVRISHRLRQTTCVFPRSNLIHSSTLFNFFDLPT
jgi:hypothetical protein